MGMRKIKEPRNKPVVIAFEGIDGSGKSTQIERLAKHLRKIGLAVGTYKWHSRKYAIDIISDMTDSGCRTPELVGALLAMSFMANITEALDSGLDVVLFDRFWITGQVKDIQRGLSPDLSESIYRHAPDPDVLFYFQLTPREGLARIKKTRSLNLYETGLQNSFGAQAKEVKERFDNGGYGEEELANLFLKEKERDLEIYRTINGGLQNVVDLDANASVNRISQMVIENVSRCLGGHNK